MPVRKFGPNAQARILDAQVKRLLSVPRIESHGPNAPNKAFPTSFCLAHQDIATITTRARQIFINQPALLELEAPLKICGDVHGQFGDLMRIFDYGGPPELANYLFLGDYVDRGKQSLEVIMLLFAYKIRHPENFFLLRGNHECQSITKVYGFFDECKRRVNIKVWKMVCDVFMTLPVAAVIEEKILCMHGGLSPELVKLNQINTNIQRPTDIPDKGLLCDLLWADPEPNLNGWKENDRGVSYVFGGNIVSSFLKKHNLDLIVRAHQVVQDGYEFFQKRQLTRCKINQGWEINSCIIKLAIEYKLFQQNP